MARVTLYLPDHLHDRAKTELPADVSWSLIFRAALESELAERAETHVPGAHEVRTPGEAGEAP